MPGLAGGPHQPIARIRDERCPGIGYQRDGLACRKAFQQPGTRRHRVVVVVRRERCHDAVMSNEAASDTGILTGNQIHAGKYLERAQCHMAQVSDRSRHHVKTGCCWRRLDGRPRKNVAPRSTVYKIRHLAAYERSISDLNVTSLRVMPALGAVALTF